MKYTARLLFIAYFWSSMGAALAGSFSVDFVRDPATEPETLDDWAVWHFDCNQPQPIGGPYRYPITNTTPNLPDVDLDAGACFAATQRWTKPDENGQPVTVESLFTPQVLAEIPGTEPEPDPDPGPTPDPEPDPVPTLMAPQNLAVVRVGSDYQLTWEQAGVVPTGGYDVWINGQDTSQTWRGPELSRVITGLDTSVEQCFQVESRYLQESPSVFMETAKVCVPPAAPEPPGFEPLTTEADAIAWCEARLETPAPPETCDYVVANSAAEDGTRPLYALGTKDEIGRVLQGTCCGDRYTEQSGRYRIVTNEDGLQGEAYCKQAP